MDRISQIMAFLKESPEDSFLQHALALEYVKKGDDVAARALFEEVLARDPGYVGSYYHLAGLLERMGELQLAIHWYEQGMKAASVAGEQKAYNELKAGYEGLIY
jgi:Tfp pilus assembly protein PilF